MKQRINLTKTDKKDGKPIIGTVIQLASPELVEMLGACGFDYAWIDCEHGSMHLDHLVQMLRAADATGITAFVRVPDHSPSFISRALDAGAMGIIVPGIENARQLRTVIAASRYQDGDNGGKRGSCPGTRATWHQASDWVSFMRSANRLISVWALIENTQAIENIDEILDVPGLDAIVLGPFDLAQCMGHPGEVHHPEVDAAMENVVARAQSKGVGVVASLFSAHPEDMRRESRAWLDRGVTMFSTGSDRRLIMTAMRERYRAAKDLPA